MLEILRRTELRGDDLHTNLQAHYGLVQWFLGKGVMAEPDTRFMTSYLAAVGALGQLVADVDLDVAFSELARRQPDAEARQALESKQTLIERPLAKLLSSPHLLAGWLGRFEGELWTLAGGEVVFASNPVHFLRELYHYLNMEEGPGKPPSEKIWDHDDEILKRALAFYAQVEARTGVREWKALRALFEGGRQDAIARGDDALWQACLAAHRGFQLGLELLLLIPRLSVRSGFRDIAVTEELRVVFPEEFLDPDKVRECTRALAPPPRAGADEIATPMGGAFFAREAPHLPPLVDVGDHFEEGQPLFVIEVMKMFNKIPAPFSGTVLENLMKGRDGSVVAKGQRIFRIEPDERVEEESPEAIAARRRAATLALF
jgi:biotin carboxyl carrier protein